MKRFPMMFMVASTIAGCDTDSVEAIPGESYRPKSDCEVFVDSVCTAVAADDCADQVKAGWQWVDENDQVYMLGGCHAPPSMFECHLAIERGDEALVFERCSIPWNVI